jgi:hypothetical protein
MAVKTKGHKDKVKDNSKDKNEEFDSYYSSMMIRLIGTFLMSSY